MLLQELDELYTDLVDENRLPPVGYEKKPVRFLVDLDGAGHCLSITDTAPARALRDVPDVRRAGTAAQAFPVCDNAQYVLALPQNGSAQAEQKARKAHDRYTELLATAATELEPEEPTAAAALRAVATFTADPDRARKAFAGNGITFAPDRNGDITESVERIGFRVDGVDPVELPAVRRWWEHSIYRALTGAAPGVCQVTGTRSGLARIMPGLRVKPGAAQALICAAFAAAERYNAVRSSGAQVSVAVAVRSHQALNWLLGEDHHHREIGQTTYVWWLDGEMTFDPFSILAEARPDEVADFTARPWSTRPGLSPSTTVRVLALSLTEGRIAIRFDHTSTLGVVEQNIRHWLKVVGRPKRDGTTWWPSLRYLADAAVPPGSGAARSAQRDHAVQALAQTALTGAGPPRDLLAALTGRCRAVPVPRSATGALDWTALGSRLAALNLYRNYTEDLMPEHATAGDICGRILAQLDQAQYWASGGGNRSVAERHYTGACTRPRSVFPALLRTANANLARIGRPGDGRDPEIAISQRLGELSSMLVRSGGFPAILTLQEQADFALAYWDERNGTVSTLGGRSS